MFIQRVRTERISEANKEALCVTKWLPQPSYKNRIHQTVLAETLCY
jgi:hypothetical protein